MYIYIYMYTHIYLYIYTLCVTCTYSLPAASAGTEGSAARSRGSAGSPAWS